MSVSGTYMSCSRKCLEHTHDVDPGVKLSLLELGAHRSKMLQQSVICGTLLKHFAPVCGDTFTGI